jgi:hypothetical protein
MGRKLSFMRSNTGTTVATAPDGDNSTLIANTAFVANAIKSKAPLDSPSFTGTPKATTADAGTSTTQLATTEFVTKADNLKAPVDSPSFTGTPKAPTADAGTKTTQIATTEFVTTANNNIQSQLDKKAPLDSPALTGTPTAPTASAGTKTTQIATTEFVTTADNLKANIASPSFTGQVFIPEGTNSAPGLVFQNDDSADTGLYHISNGNFGATCNGTEVMAFTPNGVNLLGTPTAPTASAGTKTTQVATTEFVTNADNLKAPLDSPSFTGTPKAPTADAGTSTTQLATTEFVTKADNLKAPLASPAFTGQVFIPEGTASAPGLVFQNDDSADTGLYHISNGNFGATCNGTEIMAFTPNGVNLLGTPTAPTASAGTKTTQLATTEFVTTADNLKAPLDSPSFTGTPKAPTADPGTKTTQLATTEFVTKADDLKAPLDSPALTGTPTAPTASAGTKTTQIATTEFVTTADNLKANNSDLLMAIGNIHNPLLDIPLKNSLAMRSGGGGATFTRSSSATYIDRYGILQVVGSDVPRFEKQGHLNEGSSTNLLTYSEQADNAVWSQSDVTVTANTTDTVDPYGTNLADKLVEDKSNSTHLVYQTVSVNSATLTFSCFVKAAECTKFRLNSYESSTPSNPIIADFDLSAVTAAPANSSTVYATITSLANGWFRVSATTTSAAKVSTNFYLQLARNGNSYTGDGSSGLFVFGAQLETSPFPTSYIPTTSATVTRAADSLTVDSIGNSNGVTDRFSEETLLFDFAALGGSQDSYFQAFSFNGESTAYRAFYKTSDQSMTLQYGADKYHGGQLLIKPTNLNVMTRYALSHDKTGSTKAYMNGALIISGSSGNGNATTPSTSITIGGGGACGHFANFRIYDRALTAYEVALA